MSRKRGFRLRDEKAKATRRKILEAATHLFARQGFHKTTMWDIASSIEMTTGAIFHHYATKDDLLNAVVDELDKEMDPYIIYLRSSDKISSDGVRNLVQMMADRFHDQPDTIICLSSLATEFSGTDHAIIPKVRKAYDRFVDSFAACIKHHPNVSNPRATAIAFIAAMQGIGVQALLRNGQDSIDALVEGFLSMLSEWQS